MSIGTASIGSKAIGAVFTYVSPAPPAVAVASGSGAIGTFAIGAFAIGGSAARGSGGGDGGGTQIELLVRWRRHARR